MTTTLGAWTGLLEVAEAACTAAGVRLEWKATSVSGHPDDEYLGLSAGTPATPEGRALRELLEALEAVSERIDPKTGRARP